MLVEVEVSSRGGVCGGGELYWLSSSWSLELTLVLLRAQASTTLLG